MLLQAALVLCDNKKKYPPQFYYIGNTLPSIVKECHRIMGRGEIDIDIPPKTFLSTNIVFCHHNCTMKYESSISSSFPFNKTSVHFIFEKRLDLNYFDFFWPNFCKCYWKESETLYIKKRRLKNLLWFPSPTYLTSLSVQWHLNLPLSRREFLRVAILDCSRTARIKSRTIGSRELWLSKDHGPKFLLISWILQDLNLVLPLSGVLCVYGCTVAQW